MTYDASTGNVILNLRKPRTFFLQLFVPHMLLDAISIFKLFKTGIIFDNDNFVYGFLLVFLHSAYMFRKMMNFSRLLNLSAPFHKGCDRPEATA